VPISLQSIHYRQEIHWPDQDSSWGLHAMWCLFLYLPRWKWLQQAHAKLSSSRFP